MASGDTINTIDLETSSTSNAKNADRSSYSKDDNVGNSSPDLQAGRALRPGQKVDKERKLGHRRVGEGGEITYKKIQTSQIMGSIQLGIQHTVGSLASKPKRDLLMMDFWEIESITFPPEGSSLTPAHHYSEFRYKIYAPIAFRYFRDLFGIQPDDFMMSMCTSPLRELSNPGASGSIFYLTDDDEFIIKTVQHKEGEFLQKLLPGYYMNLNQNPRTLLPKFFGLYCLQTSNSKNIRLVVMNNLLPSTVKLHLKYDLKGSTFKRKASKAERSKKSPTYKDLDFMEQHPNGIFLEAETYSALVKTIQRDCTVLESFKIMDYSLLLGVHNLDLASKEKRSEQRKQAQRAPLADDSDVDEVPETYDSELKERDTATGISRNSVAYRSVNRQRLVAHSTAMESIQAESEPIDDEDDVPPGGIPARSEKGERLLLFVGIIDILQSYRLKKKLEHTFKSIIHDGDTVSVCRPSFYAQRFQNFMAKTVFRKIPSPLKHSPSKRKSLSKAIQRSIESETEATRPVHASNSHSSKMHQHAKQPAEPSGANAIATTAANASTSGVLSAVPPPVKQRTPAPALKARVPPPVPPRGSPRKRDSDGEGNAIRYPETSRTLSTPGNHQLNQATTTHPTTMSNNHDSNTLQVQQPIPRFGHRRSPSNVRDWLELHELFHMNANTPPPIPPPPVLEKVKHEMAPQLQRINDLRRRDSVYSSYSTARSEARSHATYRQQPRLLNHIDIFQRQNSFLARSERSSAGSIVRGFPPIRPESVRSARTIETTCYESPRPQKNLRNRREKHKRYLQYADVALGEDGNDELEDNLLQSFATFIEVKNEIERTDYSRNKRRLPAALSQTELSGSASMTSQAKEALKSTTTQKAVKKPRCPKPKRYTKGTAPSPIPESVSTGVTTREFQWHNNRIDSAKRRQSVAGGSCT